MWIYLHPHWAGLVLFLLSAGESMTLIGSFIPGTIVMTAVGIFIGADLLSYWPMVFWAACGTLFGDALNFTLGYFLKDNIRQVWPFKTRQHWLTKGQHFFEVHGGKSIYFARFIGPLRAFAPIIAGAMRMPTGKFYVIDTLSAFTWAIIYLLPGVLLGEASLELAPDITEHLFRFVFLTLIIVIASVWIARLLIFHINEVIKNALSCLWTTIKETPSLSFIGRWFRHYKTDHPRGQLGTLFVFVVVFIAFVTWTVCVYLNSPFITLYNDEMHHFTESLRMQWLDRFMLMTTLLGEKKILAILFCLSCAWMCYQRCWRAAFFLAGAIVLGVISAYTLKAGIHFHRPKIEFDIIDGFSYPSGHVVVSTIFYGGLAYLTASRIRMKYRWIAYLIAIFIISAIACSRACLGVHWISDIVGGALLGWLCLLFMAFFYQRHHGQNIQAKKLLPALLILQALLTWGYFQHFHAKLFENYQLNALHKTTMIEKQTWWQKSDPSIPMMVTNRFGMPKELLNVQWASNQDDINALLLKQGWQSALEKHNWVLEIQHPEESIVPTVHLIFKMRYLDDQKPRLIFYKKIDQNPHAFMVLQLWQTDILVQPQSPLFVGNLTIKTDDKNVKNDISDTRLMSEFINSVDPVVTIQVLKTQTSLSPKTTLSDVPLILIQAKII
jgi:undecaprenyl-diphosphatase